MSRNRTIFVCLATGAVLLAAATAQDGGRTDGAAAEMLAAMRQREASVKSVSVTMTTRGTLPSGILVETRGVLHVLRTEQSTDPLQQRLFSRVEYRFGDGLSGRTEAVQSPSGILWFESDPAFGEVLLQLEPAVVRDLHWAGEVLGRGDLPGMADGQAQAPLGSALLAQLVRTFDLDVDGDRGQRGTDAGTWLVGRRKPALDEQSPDLPRHDAVEAFVRARDHALLEVRYQLAGETVQHVVVESLEIDPELADAVFELRVPGLRPRDAMLHAPLREQIEQALRRAEQRASEQQEQPVVRPSRR